MSPIEGISLALSALALLASAIAIYRTHFRSFSPVWAFGLMRFCAYRMRDLDQDESWYIASFGVTFSVANEGARAGRIRAMRLVLTYPELPIPDHRDVVEARWLVRPEDEERIGRNRFEWIDKFAKLWTPLIVLPGQEASHHVVFEKRWEQEVVAEAVRARLEVVTDSSDGWASVGGWEFPLHEPLWGDMLRTGVMSAMIDDEFEDADDTHSPDDLHKYLRPDGDVSTEGKLGHQVVQDLPEVGDD